MRKGLKIAFFSILFLGGVVMLTWYFIMRRELPEHARCIPKDVIAVLTLNMRELALDRASGGHLFPEMADKRMMHKELEPFSKAIELNGGLGLNETADVLAFFYHNGDAAFFGVVASVKDSIKFGKLIREQLPKQFNIEPFSLRGTTLVRFDTSAAVLGWNADIALFLFPFSNHGASETADQCAKLLTQGRDASILENENFKEHELTSFDAGIWLQTEPLLTFTKGGDMLQAGLDDVKYVSLNMDFRDGELDIRRKIISSGKNHKIPYDAPLLLTCDAKQVKGFWRIPLNLEDEKLLESYADVIPLNMLPLKDEQLIELAKTMDGNSTILMHDTVTYQMPFLSYDYDENFERTVKQEFRSQTSTGISASFGLKNETEAKKLLTAWMKEDSIPQKNNYWLLNENGETLRMLIADQTLTITNWPQSDGRKREIPESWSGLDIFFPVGEYLRPSHNFVFSYLLSKMETGQQLLSENIKLATTSKSFVQGNSRTSEIRLIMKNEEINSLIQLEELFRKIADEIK